MQVLHGLMGKGKPGTSHLLEKKLQVPGKRRDICLQSRLWPEAQTIANSLLSCNRPTIGSTARTAAFPAGLAVCTDAARSATGGS